MKIRTQFSLRFFLVAIVVLAAWLPYLLNRRGIVRLENELANLRILAELLTIDDPTKCYLIQRTSLNDDQNVWRVWLPKEREYQLCIATSGIDGVGFPKAEKRIPINSGQEHGIVLIRDNVVQSTDGSRIRAMVDGEVTWNLERSFQWNPAGKFSWGVTRATPQTASPAGKPLVIHQVRFSKIDGDPTIPFDPTMSMKQRNKRLRSVPVGVPTDGLLLWIEPIRDASEAP